MSLTDADYYISEDPNGMNASLKKERREVIARRDEAISAGVKPLWYMFITDCVRHGKLLHVGDYELSKRAKIALSDKQKKNGGSSSRVVPNEVEKNKRLAPILLTPSASASSVSAAAGTGTGALPSSTSPSLAHKSASTGELLSTPVSASGSNSSRPVARKSTGRRRTSIQHEMAIGTTSALYMRTPSPPPQAEQVLFVRGRSRYTDSENQFILQYGRYFLSRMRDPDMTKYMLAKEIHRKVCLVLGSLLSFSLLSRIS
jgi:hypothetical protein